MRFTFCYIMKTLITIIVLYSTIMVCAREKVIKKFDGSTEFVLSMSMVIQKEAANGVTELIFPNGHWKWHSLAHLNLPSKLKFEKKEILIIDENLESLISDWVKLNDIKALLIRVNPQLPADAFFRVEKCITSLKIPYAVMTLKSLMDYSVCLMETNGKVIPAKPSKDAVPIPNTQTPKSILDGFE